MLFAGGHEQPWRTQSGRGDGLLFKLFFERIAIVVIIIVVFVGRFTVTVRHVSRREGDESGNSDLGLSCRTYGMTSFADAPNAQQ